MGQPCGPIPAKRTAELRTLPRDLEDLFAHMLHSIATEYKAEASQIFQIVWCSNTITGSNISTLALYFAEADDNTVLSAETSASTVYGSCRKQVEIMGRLRSRCAGLLEADPRHCTVQYIHKSVADFLARKHVQTSIKLHTVRTEFEPFTALLRSWTLKLKGEKIDRSECLFQRLLQRVLYYAKLAELSTNTASPHLLDELDRVMSVHCQAWKIDDETTDPLMVDRWFHYYSTGIDMVQSEPWHNNF
jgi:hypothetical protein